MICKSCADAKGAGEVREYLMHARCRGGTWCDCQHGQWGKALSMYDRRAVALAPNPPRCSVCSRVVALYPNGMIVCHKTTVATALTRRAWKYRCPGSKMAPQVKVTVATATS